MKVMVELSKGCHCLGNSVFDEEEQGLFGTEMNALADKELK